MAQAAAIGLNLKELSAGDGLERRFWCDGFIESLLN